MKKRKEKFSFYQRNTSISREKSSSDGQVRAECPQEGMLPALKPSNTLVTNVDPGSDLQGCVSAKAEIS